MSGRACVPSPPPPAAARRCARHVLDDGERTAQLPGHVLDEAGLAAASGTLEQHGDLLLEGRAEELDLVRDEQVERLPVRVVLLDSVLAKGAFGLLLRYRHLATRVSSFDQASSTRRRSSSSEPSFSITKSAYGRRFSLVSCARSRASACSGVSPLR